jgi:hypothetical protein
MGFERAPSKIFSPDGEEAAYTNLDKLSDPD